jgi:capsular exopolysaccharide synthesis family protein
MSSEVPVAYVPSADRVLLGPDAVQAAPEQTSIVRLVHRLLRGRYLVAGVIAFIGATVGGVLGYRMDVPKYSAEGLVRIQPTLPKILFNTEQSTIAPDFSGFVNTQANLISNDRVIAKAMNSDAWRALRRGVDPAAESKFRKSLKVTTKRDTPQLIFVSFIDKEAKAAEVGLDEVIKAYQDIFANSETNSIKEFTLKTLDDRRQSFEKEIRDIENKIRTQSAEFETSDLTRLHDHYLDLLLELDTKVSSLKTRLLELGVDLKAPAAAPAPAQAAKPGPHVDRTPEEIAGVDREMAELLRSRDASQLDVTRLRSAGLQEKHPDLKRALAVIDYLDKQIADRAKTWNLSHAEISSSLIDPVNETPAQMADRYNRLRAQADEWRKRTALISDKKLEIEGYRRDIQSLDAKLAETNQRIDAINIESKVEERVGRIEVFLPESAPSAPTVDPRKKLAAMGFVLGGGMPVALVLLIGLLDRRLRYSDETEQPSASVPLLGILPDLPLRDAGAENTAAAVHCIHHIRTLLQISGPQRKVYVVSSPTAGDGKTSLSLALGMSFAATGRRAALVDFDLVGQGLSSRFKVTPTHSVGKAMLHGMVNGCSIATPVPSLDLMAAARDDVQLTTRISGDNVRSVIEQLKESYDIVIIDTGPILGSLEASIAAASADGVILVVGRGQQKAHVQAAISRLGQIGANVVGMVFNRAGATDFARSAASTSLRSMRLPESPKRAAAAVPPAYTGLDPIARSVAVDLEANAAPEETAQSAPQS